MFLSFHGKSTRTRATLSGDCAETAQPRGLGTKRMAYMTSKNTSKRLTETICVIATE